MKYKKVKLWSGAINNTTILKILAVKNSRKHRYCDYILKDKTKSTEVRSREPGIFLHNFTAISEGAKRGYIKINGQCLITHFQIVDGKDLTSTYWQQFHQITDPDDQDKFINKRTSCYCWHLEQAEEYPTPIYAPYTRCDGQSGIFTCLDFNQLTLNPP